MADLKILSDNQATPSAEPSGTLDVTEAGASGVRKYLTEHQAPDGAALRVGVRGGGCSGLSYVVEVDTQPPKPTDHVIDKFGVRVLVDPRSMRVLAGTTLDYKVGLMEAGFNFINPRATRTCGCGESFSIA